MNTDAKRTDFYNFLSVFIYAICIQILKTSGAEVLVKRESFYHF